MSRFRSPLGLLEMLGGFGWSTSVASPRRLAVLAIACAGLACQPQDRPPELEPIPDHTVAVGEQLTVMLRGTDPDGDALSYSFASNIEGLELHASLSEPRPDGVALFRWTPLASDVGSQWIDFSVSDGTLSDTVTATIEVEPLGEGGAPVFREPLGSGATLDLARESCITVPVVVEDLDDAEVAITQEQPVIEGAELTPESGLTASWTWCPQKHQLAQQRHVLRLGADDGRNPKAVKEYLLVLRTGGGADCPGEAPRIEHSADDWSTVLDLEVTARIRDDLGLKHEPIVYYSLTEPRLPLDFSELELATMSLVSGDERDGQWRAMLPNPVADGGEGDRADIYYVISAGDNDDVEGDCDHVVEAPVDGVFTATVTHPGGSGALELCEPCSADAQCGETDDLCLPVEQGGACGQACDPSTCPEGFACLTMTSIGGTQAKQCVDVDDACASSRTCDDDDFEDNDTRQQASMASALGEGVFEGLRRCSDDDDWYKLEFSVDTTIYAVLDGGTTSNLHLALHDDDGNVVAVSEQPGSLESVESCLSAGIYYLRAYAFAGADNEYDLTVDFTPGSCTTTCVDDDFEDNDALSQATYAEVYPNPYTTSDRMLCSGDDDWYQVELYVGESLVVDLTFEQNNLQEDLDLHFFDETGQDLTPCSESEPLLCSAEQGQSADSNEHYSYLVADTQCLPCSFYVVVRGWAGAENAYDLSLAIE